MANGVNVKMGVSGIAQFKQSINQAKTSIKTLDAQLALTEKQYKATGDAETYMQQKTEQLQSKMEAQRAVVENAEKALNEMRTRGVDMNSKAFQGMVQQLAKANADLLDTQMQMQGVEAAADDSAAAVTDMASELSSIGSQVSFQTVTDGLDKIANGLSHAALKAIDLGKELVRSMLGAGEWADQINEEAQKAGLDPETYQRMLKTANIIDTSVDSIISSKDKLGRAAYDANDDIKEIFASLGIQYQRYGETDNLDDLFWKTGEALMKLNDDAKKADWGKTLFGNWRELIPLFTAGREEYEETMEKMSVVDQEHLDNLQKQDDAYKTLQEEINTLKMNFLGELSPTATKVMEALTGMVQKFNEYLQSEKGQEMMESLGENIEKLFSSITNFDPEDAVKKIGDVMGAIESGFRWISDNWESVETGLKAIAAGWAAIKVATVGLKIGELVTGLKGLPFFNGSKNSNPVSGGNGTDQISPGSAAASGAGVGVTTAATKVAGIAGAAGMIPAVTVDRILNETNFGRAIRDGGDIIEGLQKDYEDTQEQLNRNLETIADNWDPNSENANVIAKLFGSRDENQDAAERLGTANWAPSIYGGSIGNGSTTYEEANSKMDKLVEAADERNRKFIAAQHYFEELQTAYSRIDETAEEMTGSTNEQTKASTQMTQAADNLMNLPELVENAVLAGMSAVKIYIDGQQAGNAVAPFVDGWLGGILAMGRE